jgi:transcriptional regulator with XRE-family HTH domain
MSESIGAALRRARERRQLTLAQVSETTRVRSHYLQALENGDISAMPSAAQARGFLKIYADFLGLDLRTLIPPAAEPVPAMPTAAPVPTAPAARSTAQPGGPGLVSRLREGISALVARKRESHEAAGAEPPAAGEPETPAAAPAQMTPAEADLADKKKAPS